MLERAAITAEAALAPIVLCSLLLGLAAFATLPVLAASPQGAPAAKPTPPPEHLEPIAPDSVVAILGQKVRGPSGEDMGTVVDVLVDGDGHPKAVVIDFGGFLGVGSRKIAVDWHLLHFQPGDAKAPVRLSLGRAAVQAAPEYKPAKTPQKPAEMVGPPPGPASSDAER